MAKKTNHKPHGKRKLHVQTASLTPDKGTAVQRPHKDTLFRFIFRDKKKLLQLYNALNQSDYQDPDGLQITTLENVVYLSYKNDISFLVDMTLYLVEHQGSWNPNMPFRGVLYFARIYRDYVEQKGYDLYGTKRFPLPVPRYVVFYNGREDRPERQILKLSDSFPQKSNFSGEDSAEEKELPEKPGIYLPPPALECQALMLNINYGHNREFMKQCKPLMEYSRFIHCIRENIRNGCSPTEAADLAVEYCLANGILTDVLRAHRKEVVGMFLEDYDEELHYRTLRREGYEDGFGDGEKSKIKKLVKKKLDKGKSIEVIAEELEETVESIEEIVKEFV